MSVHVENKYWQMEARRH